ncbi:MAG: glycosyltransferase [Egibacteraceae bacterium]
MSARRSLCGRDRLRVAHLCTVDSSLPILLGTELLADLEAGFEVYGISAPGPYVEEVERLGVRHVAVPALTRSWDLRRDLAAARELLGVVRRLNLDVLHTHNPKTGVLGRIVGRAARVPVVVNTCHGLWAQPADGWAKKALVYGAETVAAWFSDAELYQNDADRQILRRVVPQRRVRTVGNGIDLERFRRDGDGRRRVRAELGVADDEVLVGGVGRLVAEKGVREFAAAAQALAGRATFVWAGPADPDKPDRLRADEKDVRFLGWRRDMPAFYSALDIFALPTYREGFCRSGMEAAACGCGLVLTDIRGCREIGQHERHLLMVPPRDEQALTTAVARLIDDPPLRRQLGASATARARRSFDQRRVAEASIRTYEAVARRKGASW